MPSQTKIALPMRWVIGHDQAADGIQDAKSASKAIVATGIRRHRIIVIATLTQNSGSYDRI